MKRLSLLLAAIALVAAAALAYWYLSRTPAPVATLPVPPPAEETPAPAEVPPPPAKRASEGAPRQSEAPAARGEAVPDSGPAPGDTAARQPPTQPPEDSRQPAQRPPQQPPAGRLEGERSPQAQPPADRPAGEPRPQAEPLATEAEERAAIVARPERPAAPDGRGEAAPSQERSGPSASTPQEDEPRALATPAERRAPTPAGQAGAGEEGEARPSPPEGSGRRASAAPAPAPKEEPAPRSPDEDVAPAADDAAAADDEAEADEAEERVKPSFDVVRVERGGESVIAGRAAPGSQVTVTVDGQAYATVRADRRGEWVVVGEPPLPAGDYEVGLRSLEAGGEEAEADSVVVVSVPGEPAAEAAPAPADAVPPAGAAPDAAAEAPGAAPEGAPLVVMLRRESGEVSRVMQGPVAGITVGELSLDAVTYDEVGRLTVVGRVPAEGRVFVYIDNGFYGDAVGDEAGRWRLDGRGRVEMGLHRLRVDHVDAAGKVLARVETPFMRAGALADGLPQDRFVIVQPGNSLWRIARREYGEGLRYSLIFQANRDQIGEPDLIYPGQIFVIPSEE